MVQLVQLAGIQEHVPLDVGREGVVLVGVPQALRDLDELVCAGVPGVVVVVLVQPEVARDPEVEGGDDVPAGATAADLVEGGEPAGQVERRVVRRREGADQPDVLVTTARAESSVSGSSRLR